MLILDTPGGNQEVYLVLPDLSWCDFGFPCLLRIGLTEAFCFMCLKSKFLLSLSWEDAESSHLSTVSSLQVCEHLNNLQGLSTDFGVAIL